MGGLNPNFELVLRGNRGKKTGDEETQLDLIQYLDGKQPHLYDLMQEYLGNKELSEELRIRIRALGGFFYWTLDTKIKIASADNPESPIPEITRLVVEEVLEHAQKRTDEFREDMIRIPDYGNEAFNFMYRLAEYGLNHLVKSTIQEVLAMIYFSVRSKLCIDIANNQLENIINDR